MVPVPRVFVDSDSDVISLGECIRLPPPKQLFTETQGIPTVSNGESCFAVLHQSKFHSSHLEDLATGTVETGPSGKEENQGPIWLNSYDPYPHLRRPSGPSRSFFKTYFEKNPPTTLSKDHTTVAFSEDQVYNLIRVACDETAHASFEMMSGLLQRASRLPASPNVSSSHTKTPRHSEFRPATPMPSSVGTPVDNDVCPVSSDTESYTSGAIQTGDSDFSVASNTDIEDQSPEPMITIHEFLPPQLPGASGSSQGRVTLASLRKEALEESTCENSSKRPTRTIEVGDPPTKKQRMSSLTKSSRRVISAK